MRTFIAGGAGFIGSHLAHRILKDLDCEKLIIYDNFSSGNDWHIQDIIDDPRVVVVRDDIKNLENLTKAMMGCDIVFHFASNPDIAKAMTQPDVDFWEGTYLTQNILEAMRISGVKRILYASGSGVYGETGYLEVPEDYGPMLPISTYGASKLAGEALICAYCHMFDMKGRAFRFANVVGPRQTHGVAYDFIRKLQKDPTRLKILGDGSQSKSYIYVSDIIKAMLIANSNSTSQYDFYNVATGDYIDVKKIADIVVQEMGLKDVQYEYTGGDRGWKGDVPVVRFDLSKITSIGWHPSITSEGAIRKATRMMLKSERI